MRNEDKFWLGVWALAAIVVIALILAVTSTGHDERRVLQDMVAKGANPMVAGCSLGIAQSNLAVCTILATQSK